jgi:anaerobic selenocysteine-containing dehydrogenase
MIPIRGQNNVQGASDVGAIPFAYTDYRSVTDPAIRAEYAAAWGVPEESLSLEKGLMVTEIAKEGSGVRGMYILGENPVLSDPNITHAEEWFRRLEFLAVQDLFLTETARPMVLPGSSFAKRTAPSPPVGTSSWRGRPTPEAGQRDRRSGRSLEPARPARADPRYRGRTIAKVTWRGVTCH